jgi:cysteine desulfurase family protein
MKNHTDMALMNIIYFDNAATSWPKPEETILAMNGYNSHVGASPGRSAHRQSIEAGRMVFETRDNLAQLLGVEDPARIVFLKNATEALNLSIFGLLKPGDHVITSGMEHNSVMRPLRAMEAVGVELSVLPCTVRGDLDPQDIFPAIKKNTKAIYLTHASNVTGTIMLVAEVGKIAHDHGLIFCVDAAQTAGAVPINVRDMPIDLLAFTGHKALFGPQGTGGLYIGEGLEKQIKPIMMGGTGSRSEFEQQPDFLPDRYESGTPNAIGLAGLGAGVRYILSRGIDRIRGREEQLTAIFIDGLRSIKGVTIYGDTDVSRRVPVVSFNIKGLTPSEVSLALDEQFEIMSRPGLHCAPSAHRTIGTFPVGTVRFSFSCFNTEEEIYTALDAIRQIRDFA